MWYSVVANNKVQVSKSNFHDAQSLASLWDHEFDSGGINGNCKVICTPTKPSIGEELNPDEIGALVVTTPATQGHWQKTIPVKSGLYYTADRDGNDAGLKCVAYHDGELVFAGMSIWTSPEVDAWQGWWWSVPVVPPPHPPEW
jgi:hypothetical protein